MDLEKKKLTDKEYLELLADELEKTVGNGDGYDDYVRITTELAKDIADRVRNISKKIE